MFETKQHISVSKPDSRPRLIDQTLMTPNMSNSLSLDLTTSFLNVLDKTAVSQQKKSQHRDASTFAKVLQKSANFAKVFELNDLRSPVKSGSPSDCQVIAELNVDVTPASRLQQEEESLITPPSEGYHNPEDQTPSKRGSKFSRYWSSQLIALNRVLALKGTNKVTLWPVILNGIVEKRF